MAHDHDMNVTNMLWQPAMLRLTQIAEIDHDENQETVCFVAPQHIVLITRTARTAAPVPPAGSPVNTERCFGETTECTQILIGPSLGLYVKESPETVALMRDRALGHNPALAEA